MKVQAAVLCAGRGERLGKDKVLEDLGGRPVWKWSFDTLREIAEIHSVGLVCSTANIVHIRPQAEEAAFVVVGGASRHESSRIGVAACDEAEAVLVHDAARPFVEAEVVRSVIAAIARDGAAAAAVPAVDTLRLLEESGARLVDRDKVVAMQTPQGARRHLFLAAYQRANGAFTDEMAVLESIGTHVTVVPGSPHNFKITTMEDLRRARADISALETRTGLGYDVHRFSDNPDRPLVLGGVRFDGIVGLEGHSDADVVLHAAVDALLGAASLGDIGQHFPPSDPRWKDVASSLFLAHAKDLISAEGWRISNLDVALIAERPRIMPRSDEMRRIIAGTLGIEFDRVSIKATTNEGLGPIGRGEGIAAFATATLRR